MKLADIQTESSDTDLNAKWQCWSKKRSLGLKPPKSLDLADRNQHDRGCAPISVNYVDFSMSLIILHRVSCLFTVSRRVGVLRFVLLLLALAVAVNMVLFAAVPPLLNFQGRLLNSSGDPLNGNFSLRFAIYDLEIAGTELWSETQNVTISNGTFAVLLGSATPLSPIVFAGDQCWLGIRVGSEPELAPRQRIVSSAFAYHSGSSDSASLAVSVADNSISSGKIVDGTITGSDITSGTIGGDKIAADAIISSKIQNASILGADIAASQITTSHVLNGSLLGADIANGSVTGAQIADGSIAAADLLPNSITSSEIQDLSVSTSDLADNAITSAKIANGSIGNPDIGPNAVGPTTIAADAVSAVKIVDEPGVAANVYTGPDIVFTSSDTTVKTILSRTIDPPGPDSGYVLATGTLQFMFQNNPGVAAYAIFGVSTTVGQLPAYRTYEASAPAEDAVQPYYYAVAVQGVFRVGPNADTFYLLAKHLSGGYFEIKAAELTLIYLPTSYGTVSVMSER